MQAMQDAKIACARQTPQGQMPHLRAPVTAVALADEGQADGFLV